MTPPAIIEFTTFTRLWKACDLTTDDLLAMQNECFKVLTTAPVLSGCCGARKMRFAPVSGSSGKSGGMRVIFKFYEKYSTIIMVAVYPKSMQENISATDKVAFCQALNAIEVELAAIYGRQHV